ncbi:hypothetical protein ACH4LD_11470 [Streptomyces sp. NPDC017676]|uniref:hypothetical protein n=1 Tax=Streptomyces sp. NPDC017676 TaxID=3365006 RepID=UPI00379E1E4E
MAPHPVHPWPGRRGKRVERLVDALGLRRRQVRSSAKSDMDRSTSEIRWASAYSWTSRLRPAVEKTA